MRGARLLKTLGLCAALICLAPALTPAAAATAGSGPLIAAYNHTGLRLFEEFSKNPGNIVLSPYSIGTAMAMALAGARGENEAEMAKVLSLQMSRDEVNSANAAVLASLNGAASANFRLLVADAVMLTKPGDTIAAAYVALLHDKYAAELFHDASLATVNDWVKQKTAGKIDSILDQLDPNTVMVLLNAIYLKAQWQKVFEARATQDEPFHLLDGTAQVHMMHVRSDFALIERPRYRAIRLPYEGKRIAMVVVLPNGSLADFMPQFDDNEMRAAFAALRTAPQQSVALSLPRFHAGFKAGLVQAFTALGMQRPFHAETADFSGITGKPQSQVPLVIDQIAHRAIIDVAEEGTEAAAATGVVFGIRSAPLPQTKEFKVDQPFLFAIVDDDTGAVLFEGRIVDPRQDS